MLFSKHLKKALRTNAPLLIMLFLIVVFFWFFSPNHSYLSVFNIGYILDAIVISTPLAVGGGLVVILGDIDLSPGYIGTASGVLLAVLLAKTPLPWFVVLILAIALGAAFGLLNAFLINEWKFQSFIATLAVGSFLAAGLAYILPNGKTISITHPAITWLGSAKIGGVITVPVVIALVVILVYGIILSKTSFGRSIYLCGENKKAARLVGLNPRKMSYIIFANSGALGALAGILYDARQYAGNLTATNSYALPSLTAAILGGLALGGGKGDMFGCFLGLLIVSCFNNGLSVVGVSPFWQDVASGALLLVALTISYFTNKNRKKKNQKGGEAVEQSA